MTTAVAVTKAAGPDNSDATIGAVLLGTDTTLEPSETAVEVLADSAYGTGAMLATLTKAGQVPVIKPWSIRPAVEGGFTLDDFG